MNYKKFFTIISVFLISSFVFYTPVKAQFQSFTFSGNSAESYQCYDSNGAVTSTIPTGPDSNGNFTCGAGETVGLKPPALQQIEVWFVRILYAIWALVASLSFLMLVYLGYQYLITRGDVTKITEIRKRIVNYIIGFALVFLAVPILTTVFRLLGIDTSVQCYNVQMPGFQFFYATLCTDPKGQILEDPCGASEPDGKICPVSKRGETTGCTGSGFAVQYKCQLKKGTWCVVQYVNTGTGVQQSSTCTE